MVIRISVFRVKMSSLGFAGLGRGVSPPISFLSPYLGPEEILAVWMYSSSLVAVRSSQRDTVEEGRNSTLSSLLLGTAGKISVVLPRRQKQHSQSLLPLGVWRWKSGPLQKRMFIKKRHFPSSDFESGCVGGIACIPFEICSAASQAKRVYTAHKTKDVF